MKIANQIAVGRRYLASLKVERDYSAGHTAPYPGWYGVNVPVLITGDYPRFYVCDVLPYREGMAFRSSKLYSVTIDKWEIEMGVFKIYEQ